MKKLFATLILSLLLVQITFACGAPQPVFGRVVRINAGGFQTGVYGVRIAVTDVDDFSFVATTALTNPFGYYRTGDLLPCNEYRVHAAHKWYTFQQNHLLIEVLDFPPSGEGVERNFVVQE